MQILKKYGISYENIVIYLVIYCKSTYTTFGTSSTFERAKTMRDYGISQNIYEELKMDIYEPTMAK